MGQAQATVYEQLITISQDYLGPATERFIVRQIATHLQKEPTAITKDDLHKLIAWLKLSFALLTDDNGLVEEYEHQLLDVAHHAKR